MRAIEDLYVSPPKGEPVLSIDEKSGIQVLSRLRSMVSASPGREARYEFEYRRHGTGWLFGCFNIRSDKVLGRCTHRCTREDFLSFMDLVAQYYRQRRVHVILDKVNTPILSRQVLRYGDFHTANDLVRTIAAFIRRWNRDHAKPFRWSYEGRPLVSQ